MEIINSVGLFNSRIFKLKSLKSEIFLNSVDFMVEKF